MDDDPWAVTRLHAASLREFYDAYVAVGFTAEEAFRLVVVIARSVTQGLGR